MTVKKNPGRPAGNVPAAGELLNKLNLGVLIVHYPPAEVSFFNSHFKDVAKGEERAVLKHIFKELKDMKRFNIRRDMELASGRVVGFTIYKLADTEFLIFLSDISYKRIFLENRGENRFYDRLSGIIAEVVHEIGNPLASVTTTLQVLHQYLGEWQDDKKEEYLNRVIDELDRLCHYLGRIRQFSRVECCLEIAPMMLKPFIDRLLIQNQDMIKAKKIHVDVDVDDSLKINVDENFFYQVLLNLILNSLDILDSEGKISIKVEEVNEFYIRLAYRNDGPPIPLEIQEKIFLPFYSTKRKGSGIGLAVSVKLMTRMGGTLKLEPPEQGWGAKFILYVPVSND